MYYIECRWKGNKYAYWIYIYISNSVRLLKRQATGLIQSSAGATWMPATRWAWLHSFSRFLMRCDDLLHIKAEATPRALCGVAMIFTCPTTEWEWAEAEAGNQWLWLWWVCDWVWVSVRVGVWVWVSVWVSGCVSGCECECAGVTVTDSSSLWPRCAYIKTFAWARAGYACEWQMRV